MNIMKKYMLLIIPLILLGQDLFPYFNFQLELQIILNMIIILILLATLLKRTTLQNIPDWVIGACLSLYLCFLYMRTVKISLFYSPMNLTAEDIRRMFAFSVNLIPSKGIIDILQNHPSALYQILGNAFMLTPLTFVMLYFKWVKSIKQAIWYSFLCTVGIELVQFLQTCTVFLFSIGESRGTDIDDIILNTMGAVVGAGCYILWSKIEKFFGKKTRKTDVTV
ncbi:VanZ family protein [Bacillus gaemokensis]|uniref:VanZ family protein n=1 Tax=Bacillus gaemokensis TaxID=574375 RepID=UPI000690DF72|nr:VanZ family protein [Bacillus gaemokensis]KYG32922.1 hypothetical protein AZF08_27345 [Bacillus gaemokensis]